jgi:hypothetical protein
MHRCLAMTYLQEDNKDYVTLEYTRRLCSRCCSDGNNNIYVTNRRTVEATRSGVRISALSKSVDDRRMRNPAGKESQTINLHPELLSSYDDGRKSRYQGEAAIGKSAPVLQIVRKYLWV